MLTMLPTWEVDTTGGEELSTQERAHRTALFHLFCSELEDALAGGAFEALIKKDSSPENPTLYLKRQHQEGDEAEPYRLCSLEDWLNPRHGVGQIYATHQSILRRAMSPKLRAHPNALACYAYLNAFLQINSEANRSIYHAFLDRPSHPCMRLSALRLDDGSLCYPLGRSLELHSHWHLFPVLPGDQDTPGSTAFLALARDAILQPFHMTNLTGLDASDEELELLQRNLIFALSLSSAWHVNQQNEALKTFAWSQHPAHRWHRFPERQRLCVVYGMGTDDSSGPELEPVQVSFHPPRHHLHHALSACINANACYELYQVGRALWQPFYGLGLAIAKLFQGAWGYARARQRQQPSHASRRQMIGALKQLAYFPVALLLSLVIACAGLLGCVVAIVRHPLRLVPKAWSLRDPKPTPYDVLVLLPLLGYLGLFNININGQCLLNHALLKVGMAPLGAFPRHAAQVVLIALMVRMLILLVGSTLFIHKKHSRWFRGLRDCLHAPRQSVIFWPVIAGVCLPNFHLLEQASAFQVWCQDPFYRFAALALSWMAWTINALFIKILMDKFHPAPSVELNLTQRPIVPAKAREVLQQRSWAVRVEQRTLTPLMQRLNPAS